MKNSKTLYDKDYFFGGKKGDYQNYFVAQERMANEYWMKHIERYGKIVESKVYLDIGCAYGIFVKKMKEREWESYGVDISGFAISEGKKIYPEINISIASSDRLPFPDKYFGYITCLDIIEHLDNERLYATANEIYRCLKPKGVCFITTPNVIDNCLVNIYSDNYVEGDETHINYQSSFDLYRLFRDAKFSRVIIKGESPCIPQITEINLKKRINKLVLNRFTLRFLYKFVGRDISYSSSLFVMVQK